VVCSNATALSIHHAERAMLAEQAAEAFAWWRGMRPDTRAVIEKLTIPLV
jgi:hypothetical protein